MPSSLPVNPNFSVVVALMLMQSMSISMSGAKTAFIFSTCGLILGRSAHIVASTLLIEYPFSRMRSVVFRNKILLSILFAGVGEVVANVSHICSP